MNAKKGKTDTSPPASAAGEYGRIVSIFLSEKMVTEVAYPGQ